MRRKFLTISFICITVLVLFATTVIYASTSELTGCTLRSSRCGDDAEVQTAMLTAKLAYDMRGYDTHSLTNPSSLLTLSNAIANNVQLYFCHGNSDMVTFEEGGLTVNPSGYYAITFPEDGNNPVNLYFHSINSIDWTNKKLITLASCNSGGNGTASQDSIAYKMANLGAQMVVGWYTGLNNESGPDWLNHYHDKLAQGATVQEAISYASSQFYVYGNVRNTHLCYNTISALSDENISTISTNDTEEINNKNILLEKDISQFNASYAEELIKMDNSNFNIDNYEKRISEGSYSSDISTGIVQKEESYIDYVLKMGDFITNSAYTVVLDNNNNIKEINDYTKNTVSAISINSDVNEFYISDEQTNYYLDKAKANITHQEDIEKIDIEFYYDLDENKKYAYVSITLNDNYDIQTEYYKYEI